MKNCCFFLLSCLLLATAPERSTAATLSGELKTWHRVTLEFTGPETSETQPHFPTLRSDPMALSGASRRKQIPCSHEGINRVMSFLGSPKGMGRYLDHVTQALNAPVLSLELYGGKGASHSMPDQGYAPVSALMLGNLAQARERRAVPLLVKLAARVNCDPKNLRSTWGYFYSLACGFERLACVEGQAPLKRVLGDSLFADHTVSRNGDLRACKNVQAERLTYLRLAFARAHAVRRRGRHPRAVRIPQRSSGMLRPGRPRRVGGHLRPGFWFPGRRMEGVDPAERRDAETESVDRNICMKHTRISTCLNGLCILAVFVTTSRALEVVQPAGSLPVAAAVDVIVVGGSSAGVTAAVKAAQQGAKAFLAAPRPYLGEDICGTYRLWLEAGEKPLTPLARELFGAEAAVQPVKPMSVKTALDKALLDAGVQFLYASFVTEVVRDAKGQPAGVVIANKSGRQAVLGRVIIIQTALNAKNNPPRGTENGVRDKVLPEIHLARALYRCGDYEGVAEKILRAYASDLHAHYARHAHAILTAKIKP